MVIQGTSLLEDKAWEPPQNKLDEKSLLFHILPINYLIEANDDIARNYCNFDFQYELKILRWKFENKSSEFIK